VNTDGPCSFNEIAIKATIYLLIFKLIKVFLIIGNQYFILNIYFLKKEPIWLIGSLSNCQIAELSNCRIDYHFTRNTALASNNFPFSQNNLKIGFSAKKTIEPRPTSIVPSTVPSFNLFFTLNPENPVT
jgi:hypothetical protein